MQNDKFVTRDQAKSIFNNAPSNVNKEELLKKMVSDGYVFQGYNEPKESTSSKFLAKSAEDIKTRVSNALNEVNAPTTATDLARNPFSKPLRVAGQAAGAVGDVIGNAIGTVVSDINQEKGGALANKGLELLNTEVGQKGLGAIKMGVEAWNSFKQANPETAKDLEAVVNVAGILPVGKAVKIAPELAVGADIANTANKAKTAVTGTVSNVLPIAKTPQEAIDNTYKGLMNLVENKQSLLRDFVKSEGSGKDPIKIIAENPDYMVKVNPEAKTIDAANSLANMQRDIANYSEIRDAVLKTADESLPQLSTQNIFNDVQNVFSAKNYKSYLDAGVKGVNQIVNKLKTMQQLYGDNISRYDLQQIRKGIDETINSFTDTKMQDRMRLDLRTVFKNTLENSVPENGLLKELNNQIGDLLDASKFVGSKLNGTKVKGGGLTDLAMKTAGAATGAGLGGVAFGIPGAIGGYAISNFLSKTLIKNAINNPFDRAILEKLKQVKPEIIKQAEDYINSTKSIKLDAKGGAKDIPTPSPEVPPQDLSYNANIPQLPKNGSGAVRSVSEIVDKKIKDNITKSYGAMAGVQPQYDENGKITGVKFDLKSALLGLGAGSVAFKLQDMSPATRAQFTQSIKRIVNNKDFFKNGDADKLFLFKIAEKLKNSPTPSVEKEAGRLVDHFINYYNMPDIGDMLKTNKDVSKLFVKILDTVPDTEKATKAIKSVGTDLAQEAKKYKSAEEFVDNFNYKNELVKEADGGLTKVYRATAEDYNPSKIKTTGKGTGLYVTPRKSYAEGFMEDGRKLEELYIQSGVKVLTPDDLPSKFKLATLEDIKKFKSPQERQDKIVQYAAEKGYDVVDFAGNNQNIIVVNPKVLKTKQQLIDIWNKANK